MVSRSSGSPVLKQPAIHFLGLDKACGMGYPKKVYVYSMSLQEPGKALSTLQGSKYPNGRHLPKTIITLPSVEIETPGTPYLGPSDPSGYWTPTVLLLNNFI